MTGRAIRPNEYPGWYEGEPRQFHRNDKAARLIDEHGGTVLRFRDLPVLAQCALIHYMAVDGEAWDFPEDADRHEFVAELPKHVPFYVARYGDTEFGLIESVPLTALVESCMRDAELSQDWGSFAEYHDWYMRGNEKHPHNPKHAAPDMWPVILSSFGDETLEDGWTRFHQYCDRRDTACPALFFLHKEGGTE